MKKILSATTLLATVPFMIVPAISCTTTSTAPSAKGSSAGRSFIAEMMLYLGYKSTSVKYTDAPAMTAIDEMTGKENFFFSTAGQVIPTHKDSNDAPVEGWKNNLTRTFTIGKTGVTLAVRVPESVNSILETDAHEIKLDINEVAKVFDDDPVTKAVWRDAIINKKENPGANDDPNDVFIDMYPLDASSKDSPLAKKLFNFFESPESGITQPASGWDYDFSTATPQQGITASNIDNGLQSLSKIYSAKDSLIVPVTYADLVTKFKGKFGWGTDKSNGIYPVTLVDTKGTATTEDDVNFTPVVAAFESTTEFSPSLSYPMTVPVNMMITHASQNKDRGNDAYSWIASQAMSPQFQEHMRVWLGIGRLTEKEIAYQTGWTFDTTNTDSRIDMNWTDAEIIKLSKELEAKGDLTLKNNLSYGLNI